MSKKSAQPKIPRLVWGFLVTPLAVTAAYIAYRILAPDQFDFLYYAHPTIEVRDGDYVHPGDKAYGHSTVLVFEPNPSFQDPIDGRPSPLVEEMLRKRLPKGQVDYLGTMAYDMDYSLFVGKKEAPTFYAHIASHLLIGHDEVWIHESAFDHWIRTVRQKLH